MDFQETFSNKMNETARKYLELSSLIGQPKLHLNETRLNLIYNDMFINVEYMFMNDKYKITNSIDDVEIYTTTLNDLQNYIYAITHEIHDDKI